MCDLGQIIVISVAPHEGKIFTFQEYLHWTVIGARNKLILLSTEILGLFVTVNSIILSITARVFVAVFFTVDESKASWLSITVSR